MTSATYFCVGYIVFIPWLTSTYCAYAKIVDDQEGGKTTPMAWVLLGISIVHCLALMGCTGVFMSRYTALSILGLFAFIIYMIVQFVIYRRNEYNMPSVWAWINSILLSLVFIGVLAAGVYSPLFSAYTAGSMTLWTAVLIIGLCASVLFYRDEA
jgi:glucan phosphoethanolaminetransferase (alkaline phosphatase superfamily)